VAWKKKISIRKKPYMAAAEEIFNEEAESEA